MANGSFEPRYPEIGDGQPAINASLNSPIGLAVSSLSGALFFTDASDMLLRMVDANGTIWTVAGVWQKSQTSYYDFNAFAVQPSGDGVNVSNTTTFAGPYSVAIDATDNVFVSEGASRRVSTGGLFVYVMWSHAYFPNSTQIRELNYGQTLSCPAGCEYWRLHNSTAITSIPAVVLTTSTHPLRVPQCPHSTQIRALADFDPSLARTPLTLARLGPSRPSIHLWGITPSGRLQSYRRQESFFISRYESEDLFLS